MPAMKSETSTEMLKAVPAVVGVTSAWSLQEASQATSIVVGTVTICYVIVQLFYLVRKWYVQEKRHAERLAMQKALEAKKTPSGFGDLDQPL